MSFPQIATTSNGNINTDSNSYSLTLPSGINPGDLLLLFISFSNSPTLDSTDDPYDWNQIGYSPGTPQIRIWSRIATGEEGTSFPIDTVQASKCAYVAYRITNWHGTTLPEISTVSTGTSSSPNSSTLNPTGWGIEDTLWISVTAWNNGTSNITFPPTGFDENQVIARANSSTGVGISTATDNLAVDLVDPGPFTLSPDMPWKAYTIAVRPPSIPSHYAEEILKDNPHIYWDFSNFGTTVFNKSPYSYDGTNGHSSIALRVPGRFVGEYAESFQGTTSYYTYNSSVPSSDIINHEIIFKRNNTTAQNISIFSQPGTISCYIDTTGTVKVDRFASPYTNIANSGSTKILDTNWHHLLVTKNGTTTKIYLDGVDVTVVGTNVTFSVDSTDSVYIAYSPIGGSITYSNITVDEYVYMNGTAWSAIRALEHYNAAFEVDHYKSAVAIDNPTAYYKFAENTIAPTVEDYSGNSNILVYQNTPTLHVQGRKVGEYAISLDKVSSEYVRTSLSSMPFSNIVNYEIIFKRNSTTSEQTGLFTGTNLGCYIDTDGTIKVNYSTTLLASGSIKINDTNWHHLIITKSGSVTKIYLDGVDVTVVGTDATVPTTSTYLYIGFDNLPSTIYGNITLDEFAYTNGSILSKDRIQAHYQYAMNNKLSPPTSVGTYEHSFFIENNSDDDIAIRNASTWAGLSSASTTNNYSTLNIEASKNFEGTYTVRNGLMRWNTVGIPDNAIINSVQIKVFVKGIDYDNARSFSIGWKNPGFTDALNEWTLTEETDALGLTLLSGIGYNTIKTFTLNNPSSLNKQGMSSLRTHISGAAPSGYNYLVLASREAGYPPELIVNYTVPYSDPYVNQIMSDNPVIYLRLGETSGILANDETTNNLDGTYVNSPTLGVSGAVSGNTATLFNSNQYLTVNDANALDTADIFSVEMWIKRSNTTALLQELVNKGSGSYSIYLDTDHKIKLQKYGTGLITSSTNTIADTNWHHIVVAKNGNNAINPVKIYIDGVDVTSTVTNQIITNTTNALFIAARPTPSNYFNGYLDEVAIYSTALSQTRAAEHYSSGGGTPPPPSTQQTSLNVYMSTDGSNYSLIKTITNPASTNWTTDIIPSTLLAPSPTTLTIDNLIEKSITLNWANPGNAGSKRWFKVSNVVDGVESALTTSRDATATPLVTRYVLEKKLQTQTDSFFIKIYDGNSTGYTDTNIEFGLNYVYRITAYNSLGQPSTSTTKDASAPPPYPPNLLDAEVKDNLDSSQFIRITGNELKDATEVQIQKLLSDNATWANLKLATIGIPTGGTSNVQWWGDDTSPTVLAPNAAVWSLATQPVDTSGVHLKWTAPANNSSNSSYRALRKFGTILSGPSNIEVETIQPYIQKYDIQRRETPVPGVPLVPANNWVTIESIIATEEDPIPDTSYDDTAVSFSKVYDYRIITTNNFGIASNPSITKTLSTFDAPPPPPPPPPPIGGVVSNARPTGVVDITSEGLLRLVWDYSHPNNESQSAYIIKAQYTDESDELQTRYWNGSTWSTNTSSIVQSSVSLADVDPSIFTNGRRVDLFLEVISLNGGRSNIYGE